MFHSPLFCPRATTCKDPNMGGVWSRLSIEDQNEYIGLREAFHQVQKNPVKDKRFMHFSSELATLLAFTERSNVGVEERSIVAGIAFAGPYICVNTRQLKEFMGKCKSSLNGSFQQLGYVAIRTKQKAKECILACLPSLATDAISLRQWTVRHSSADSMCCFVSKVVNPARLPTVTDFDLYDDGKSPESPPVYDLPVKHQEVPLQAVIMPEIFPSEPRVKDLSVKQLSFDLSCFDDVVLTASTLKIPDITPSFSMSQIQDADDFILSGFWTASGPAQLTHSQSWIH